MKKFLLFVAAAAIAVSANAQLSNRMAAGKAQSQQKALPAASFKKQEVKGMKKNVKLSNAGFAMNKKFQLAKDQMSDIVLNPRFEALNKARRASELGQYYYGFGQEYGVDSISAWAMIPYTYIDSLNNVSNWLVNLVPNVLSADPTDANNYIFAPYEMNEDTLIVKPLYLGANKEKGYYFFLADFNSDDCALRYTINEKGYLTYAGEGNVKIAFLVFNTPEFDPNFGEDTYLGYWTYFSNVKYYKNDQPFDAPKVAFAPYNTVLYAGLGATGYSYNANLAMIGAYAPTIFQNLTTDVASAWDWSVERAAADGTEEVVRSTEEHFILNTTGNDVYSNLALVGSMIDAKSDSCKWGVGKTVDEESVARYNALYAYAGETGSSFQFDDGSYATMTTMDPDQDLAFYTNWGTPDLYDRVKMSKIYVHMGTPSAPLFFTGVTVPLVSFKDNGKFNLQAKIRKCDRSSTGRLTLGDVVAEANATIDDVVDNSATSGITSVNFTKFFVTDEFGMTTEKDHFFMDEEFLVEIDGWNNGTFSGVLGCADLYNDNDPTSVWFEKEGEEGSTYSYNTWKTKLFIGLIDASYGFLNTSDPTEHQFTAAGGQSTMHILPMLYSNDENGNLTTRLFVEEEIPEWIHLSTTDPASKDNIAFDLTIAVDALPNGLTGRYAYVNLFQEGAQLPLLIVQGDGGDLYKTPVTLSKTGYGTFYDLENTYVLPEGLKAMVVSDIDEKGLVYTQVDTIYADVPVVLASTNGKTGTYKLNMIEPEGEFNGYNLLVDYFLGYHYCYYYGEENFKFYKMTYSNDGKKFGWYWGAPNGGFFEIEENKAMLMLDVETAEKARAFSIDGTAITGIEEIAAKQPATDNAIYNLQGVRVAKAKKGLYIVNNKKVVIK